MAANLLLLRAFLAVVAVAVGVSGETHHFVGGDDGLGPDFNLTSWIEGRVFRVGDKLWFKYDGPDEDMIMEVNGPDELESCDVSNPIKMYVDRRVPLEREGLHYFASGNVENCRSGLKLIVPVQ
ncbi:copper binding protein 1, partial [Genlisea aurea]